LNLRHPAIPYILPFGVFVVLLAIQSIVPVPVSVRFVVSMAAILGVSLPVLRGGPSKPIFDILLGILVFAIWVGPDFLAPNWHHFILFDNPITGHPAGNTPPLSRNDPVFLFFRIAISVIAVPILEELFWRSWMLRWIAATNSHQRDFRTIDSGIFVPLAFWVVAILFAVEHGSFWDVGLITGMIFNWWMIRTRNVWDCILTHAITNAALAVYVVVGGHWQYWL
jgi:CAAX prenyl protease-like protein